MVRAKSTTPPGVEAALDSRFLSDSFFVRFSLAMTPVSSGTCDFLELWSGLRGEETAGEWPATVAGIGSGADTGAGAGTVVGAEAGAAPAAAPAPAKGVSLGSSLDMIEKSLNKGTQVVGMSSKRCRVNGKLGTCIL